MQRLVKTALVLSFVFCSSSFAIDDTVANRTAQADRYMEATPPKEMLIDIVEGSSAKMPATQKKAFQELMLKYFDIDDYSKDMKDALVKHFSADELSALADFYGSPTGKSIMKKMKVLTAEIMPKAQAQSMKAIQKMLSDKAKTEQKSKPTPNSSI
jgi:hypothetical protein